MKLMHEYVKTVTDMTDDAKTMGDLQKLLHALAFTIGGMVCHFDKEERSNVLIGLTQAVGNGFMDTSVNIGEPSDIEMIVGSGKR